jgi:hypothetical protein
MSIFKGELYAAQSNIIRDILKYLVSNFNGTDRSDPLC